MTKKQKQAPTTIDIYKYQRETLRDVAYNYASYKELHTKFSKSQDDFWILTLNSHLLQTINSWCMIFGSKNNQTHWEYIIKDKSQQNNFRKLLYRQLKTNRKKWNKYKQSLIVFRNKYVAHREIGFDDPIPFMKQAMEALFTYDSFLRKWIKDNEKIIENFSTLENHYDNFTTKTKTKLENIH